MRKDLKLWFDLFIKDILTHLNSHFHDLKLLDASCSPSIISLVDGSLNATLMTPNFLPNLSFRSAIALVILIRATISFFLTPSLASPVVGQLSVGATSPLVEARPDNHWRDGQAFNRQHVNPDGHSPF